MKTILICVGRSELHRSPQITTDTTDHTDPNHRSHRSLGNGTDPSKFIKYGSKSIKYGPGLPDNHSDVPMASLGTRSDCLVLNMSYTHCISHCLYQSCSHEHPPAPRPRQVSAVVFVQVRRCRPHPSNQCQAPMSRCNQRIFCPKKHIRLEIYQLDVPLFPMATTVTKLQQ